MDIENADVLRSTMACEVALLKCPKSVQDALTAKQARSRDPRHSLDRQLEILEAKFMIETLAKNVHIKEVVEC